LVVKLDSTVVVEVVPSALIFLYAPAVFDGKLELYANISMLSVTGS
jgi:hypothetical protein